MNELEGLNKKHLSSIILKLLEENQQMSGYEITTRLKAHCAGKATIKEGALYPVLHKMESDGILQSEMVNIGNRLRKYYKLTEGGAKEAVKEPNNIKALLNQLQLILNPKFVTP